MHDSPSLPGSYGSIGWLAGDAAILINDRFDIWKIDPKSPSEAINLTLGEGRNKQITFRRERLKADETSIDPNEPLILSAFNEVNKDNGFFYKFLRWKNGSQAIDYVGTSLHGVDQSQRIQPDFGKKINLP
ncbi:hypothetical protein [Algoriphagus boritolerans]|uniref:hypothetical protein n=1 Tax=Algoriphagus boritolerans TaxID=308111 RepID=UPI002FCE41C8